MESLCSLCGTFILCEIYVVLLCHWDEFPFNVDDVPMAEFRCRDCRDSIIVTGFYFGLASRDDGFPQSDLHEQKVYEDSCIHKLFDGSIIEFEMCLSKNSVSYFWMGSSGYESRDVHESVRLNVLAWQYAHASTDQRGAVTF